MKWARRQQVDLDAMAWRGERARLEHELLQACMRLLQHTGGESVLLALPAPLSEVFVAVGAMEAILEMTAPEQR